MIVDLFEQSLVNKSSGVAEEDWYSMHDVYSYLSDPLNSRVPLYISQLSSRASAVIYSTLVPKAALHGEWREELKDWRFDPWHSWGYGWSNEDGAITASLFPPYTESSDRILESSHPIVIPCYNLVLPKDGVCIDISQEITHTHGLHWSESNSAYIRLDELGDLEECVRVRGVKKNVAVDILSDLLRLHLFVGDYVFVRLFDVRRWTKDTLFDQEVHRDEEVVAIEEQKIYGSLLQTKYEDGAKFYRLRGFQCISVQEGEEQALWQELKGEKPREYCEFVIRDWKNKRTVKCSSDPKCTANYFTKSDLPFETSPAFFRREVLRKYKDDLEKYTINEETGVIDCRGAWSLLYGTNDVGQIHAYICDLALLPYREQLHWKTHNEEPKAGLSKSTVRRDFYAEPVFDPPDHLSQLKTILNSFPSVEETTKPGPPWMLPSDDSVNRLMYMTGESQKEWENDILDFAQVVIEGFDAKFLRVLVRKLSPDLPDLERLGSIKLLDHLLCIKSIAEDIRDDIVPPLIDLQKIRSKVCGHRQGDDAAEIIASVRTKHKTFSKHQKYLIGRVLIAMRTLADLIQNGTLTTDF
ncbi:MAG: hypothetical protein ACUZ8A_09700 [Candidatus Bathyanammoxibius sp.]